MTATTDPTTTAASDPAVTVQPATDFGATIDPGLGVNLLDHIVGLLNDMTLVGGGVFIKTSAVVDNGYIHVEVRRVRFDGEDVVVSQLLHPVDPVVTVDV